MHQSYTDNELIRLYKVNASTYTLPILYERYGHLVFGLCLKYLKNKNDAEDLTMNIYETLGQKLIKHEITHFKSWLYQVTKNECYMILRKKNPVTISEFELADNDTESLENLNALETNLNLLEKGIKALKEEQRLCVEQFYIYEKSYQEISIEFELPINTVKSAIQNGKRNLKIWMENHG
jgi:RNA polymerase sigma-70 factor (ECF subfamily)